MADYELENIWNADESGLYYNDTGRMIFAPAEHAGRLVKGEKQRFSVLIYVNASGEVSFRPCIIDYNFPTGSKQEAKKEIRKKVKS